MVDGRSVFTHFVPHAKPLRVRGFGEFLAGRDPELSALGFPAFIFFVMSSYPLRGRSLTQRGGGTPASGITPTGPPRRVGSSGPKGTPVAAAPRRTNKAQQRAVGAPPPPAGGAVAPPDGGAANPAPLAGNKRRARLHIRVRVN